MKNTKLTRIWKIIGGGALPIAITCSIAPIFAQNYFNSPQNTSCEKINSSIHTINGNSTEEISSTSFVYDTAGIVDAKFIFGDSANGSICYRDDGNHNITLYSSVDTSTTSFTVGENPVLNGKFSIDDQNYTVVGIGPRALCYLYCDLIGNLTFTNCESLTYLDGGVFYSQNKLTSVDLNGCTALSEFYRTSSSYGVFETCSGLVSIYNLPTDITVIPQYFCFKCYSLTNVDLIGCTKLTNINGSSFSYCSALPSVAIPKNVQNIGYNAFSSCTSLSILTFGTDDKDYFTNATISDYWLGTSPKISNIYVNINIFDDLYTAIIEQAWYNKISPSPDILSYGWTPADDFFTSTDGSNVVGSIWTISNEKGINLLSSNPFDWNEQTYSYVEGDNLIFNGEMASEVVSIGDDCFSTLRGSNIAGTLSFKDGVNLSQIGSNAFNGNINLNYVDLSNCDSLTTIDDNTFKDCTSLSSIIIPEGVNTINDGAFQNTNLSNVNLPLTLTKIGQSCFQNCTNLTTITLNKDISSIGQNAFDGCISLTQINLNWRTQDKLDELITSELISSNWLGSIDKNKINVKVPKYTAYLYSEELTYNNITKTYAEWLGIDGCNIYDGTEQPTNNNTNVLGLALGLGLGLGIPAFISSILAISLANKKHKFWY